MLHTRHLAVVLTIVGVKSSQAREHNQLHNGTSTSPGTVGVSYRAETPLDLEVGW